MKKRCKDCNNQVGNGLLFKPYCGKKKTNKNGSCKNWHENMCKLCGERPVAEGRRAFCKPCGELADVIC